MICDLFDVFYLVTWINASIQTVGNSIVIDFFYNIKNKNSIFCAKFFA